MKIKDAVVIPRWVLNQIIEELNDSDKNDYACTLNIESKELEPIVKDAYFKEDYLFELTPADFNDYLNDTEI